MKKINVIQARMGSTRLPGKSMMELLPGMTLIEMIIRRVIKSRLAENTVLATSINSDCDPLCEIAEKCGCSIVRGSEEDVLSRFVQAAEQCQPNSIVRICADNPFISPIEIDKLITFFNDNKLDYASNNTYACGLPDGLGAEIVNADALKSIYKRSSIIQKEHVTQYILENSDQFKIGYLKADEQLNHPDIKLDIDTLNDFEYVRLICRKLDKTNVPYWTSKEIITQSLKF